MNLRRRLGDADRNQLAPDHFPRRLIMNQPASDRKQLGAVDREINLSRDKLSECHNDLNEFKIVANNLVWKVGDALMEMNRNQTAQRKIVTPVKIWLLN